MIALGLSVPDRIKFELGLITGYNLKVTVQVLDLDHRPVADLSHMLLDGQVNKAFREPVTSGLTMTLLDPDSRVGFDTQSPSDGALYADRMIRIVWSAWSEQLPRWVDVPLFTGPVTGVSRDDAILSVEAQGKETLYQEPSMAWTSKTYYKGEKFSDSTGACVLRSILGDKGGETRFDLPEWSLRLARDYSLTPETPLWNMAQWVTGSQLTRQLFYDGRGVLRLRNLATTPGFTFTEAHLTSIPKLTYDMGKIRNTVLVKGATPEGRKPITARGALPPSDPSSNVALGRNGVRRHLVEVIEDSNITTTAAAQQRVRDGLAAVGIGNTSFDFDSLPMPHLEPGDCFALSTRDISITLRKTQFSVPLKAGSSQSNGTYRRISSNRARIRRR